ncbi:site-specific integrase [Ornithinicoccus hortensis]
MDMADLNGSVLEQFLADRRVDHTNLSSLQALAPTLEYLRRTGQAPPPEPPVPVGPVEEALARFEEYLLVQRSISAAVAQAYLRWVRPFVAQLPVVQDELALVRLDAAQVSRFVTGHLPGLSRKNAQMTATSLRSFLRFAHVEGLVGVDLAPAVPPFAFRRQSGLPEPLTAQQVHALTDACDPCTAVGRRDLAVITCLVRLGLRCGEVADMVLEDLDWTGGTITVHGKGGRIDVMPLPVDVGQVLVAYLRQGRPSTTERVVFLTAVAPIRALSRSGLSCIVARAARRAGLGTIHAHRLRHTAASATLNAGATLEQVSHLLRHVSPATTAVYAKTDLARLSTLTRPWPTSGSRS